MDYIVMTTVNNPKSFVDHLVENLTYYKNLDKLGLIIIGDRKTPDISKPVERATSAGLTTLYLDIEEQKQFLQNYPNLDEMIPYNTDNRRNIGYIKALELGAEIIINMDDDNLALNLHDFYTSHSIVGEKRTLPNYRGDNNWVNICEALKFDQDYNIYPRGFPYSKRNQNNFIFAENRTARIIANEGLWLGEPDVDAISRLATPVSVEGLEVEQFAVLPNNFSPFNSQNSAVHKDAMPAYYYVLQGLDHRGLKLDRYGDIWQGLFLQKIASHLGDVVSFGTPLCRHDRNFHDHFNDIRVELIGMEFSDTLSGILYDISLDGVKNYKDGYIKLAEEFYRLVSKSNHPIASEQAYFKKLKSNMIQWVEICEMASN